MENTKSNFIRHVEVQTFGAVHIILLSREVNQKRVYKPFLTHFVDKENHFSMTMPLNIENDDRDALLLSVASAAKLLYRSVGSLVNIFDEDTREHIDFVDLNDIFAAIAVRANQFEPQATTVH